MRVYLVRPVLITLVVCAVFAEPAYFMYAAAKGFMAKEEAAICNNLQPPTAETNR